MNTRPLLILVGASLLGGCVYAGPPGGYVGPGYTSASPYYNSYQSPYQPGYQTTYQPAYQPTNQPAYQPAYQANPYRPAPSAYPFYSPAFPDSAGGNGN